MAIMQTVFAVAMTLGLREIVSDAYDLIFHHMPVQAPPPVVLILAALAVTLLGVRFFWVPWNLYSYLLLSDRGPHPDRVSRNLVFFHFPIALFHAILFFFVCKSWADVATKHAELSLAQQFSGMFSLLLFVNALWLFGTTPKADAAATEDDRRPAKVWRWNNLITSLAAGALMVIWQQNRFSPDGLLLVTSLLFLANSVIDFAFAARGYLMLPGTPRDPTDAERAEFVAALSEFTSARQTPPVLMQPQHETLD